MRKRLLLALLLGLVSALSLAQPALADPQTQAQARPNPFADVPVTGSVTNVATGLVTPVANIDVQRFAVENGRAVAIASLNDATGKVLAVASIPIDRSSSRGSGSSGYSAQAQRSCRILHLELGPLDLNLLGLRIQLNRVVLDITAQRGPGNLLGNLLCAVAGLLDPAPIATLVARLNRLLGFLSGSPFAGIPATGTVTNSSPGRCRRWRAWTSPLRGAERAARRAGGCSTQRGGCSRPCRSRSEPACRRERSHPATAAEQLPDPPPRAGTARPEPARAAHPAQPGGAGHHGRTRPGEPARQSALRDRRAARSTGADGPGQPSERGHRGNRFQPVRRGTCRGTARRGQTVSQITSATVSGSPPGGASSSPSPHCVTRRAEPSPPSGCRLRLGRRARFSQRSCSILRLVLGPLDLNLLGLRIQLSRVVLNITAEPGPGNLLGNLLCAITGLLDRSTAPRCSGGQQAEPGARLLSLTTRLDTERIERAATPSHTGVAASLICAGYERPARPSAAGRSSAAGSSPRCRSRR